MRTFSTKLTAIFGGLLRLKKAPRKILMICMVSAVGAAGSLVAAGPAQAGVVCGTYGRVKNVSNGANVVPTWRSATHRSLDCHLYRGTSGDGVRQLQLTLNECYGPRPLSGGVKKFSTALAVDGQFGSATEAALETVQSYIGVTADGSYGPATRSKMKARANNGSGNWCMYLKVPVTWA
ncbi:peptidoglycan-binding domain-containing protein [Kribbella sp. CA-294648]|uniref:peptidoglycan-binding domain-containing protein n=1 Tax=Kribbella sp. CA-294648 TaxID=3239948 RepID=UPI003D94B737